MDSPVYAHALCCDACLPTLVSPPSLPSPPRTAAAAPPGPCPARPPGSRRPLLARRRLLRSSTMFAKALVLALALVGSNAFAPGFQSGFAGTRAVQHTANRRITGPMMGGNEKQLKSRIASVTNTRKITEAMRLVAAAKVRRAQQGTLSPVFRAWPWPRNMRPEPGARPRGGCNGRLGLASARQFRY